ncbi:MAG: pentapeptide repeat-containing protein [Cyanobacteriota bacterium]|nr:pentapeptide repeat-containing protein [Cyanobacteriota bacterium]
MFISIGERDFWDVDLSGIDLSNVDLSDANLNNANLIETNLNNANLNRANLIRAKLYGATLINTKLNKANLGIGQLINTDLCGADLRNAELYGANLENANLGYMEYYNINTLSGDIFYCIEGSVLANLENANLSNAKLNNANLNAVNLSNANLSNAKLLLASLYKANLSNSNLQNANLTKANLAEANLTEADLTNADLTNANLAGADLTNARLDNANITGTILDSLPLNNGRFKSLKRDKIITWQYLSFRSQSEVKIAEELDKRNLLFFPNSAARLTTKKGRENKEPDFLICYKTIKGFKWAILEVDGFYHTPEKRVEEQERERDFERNGVISVISYQLSVISTSTCLCSIPQESQRLEILNLFFFIPLKGEASDLIFW